MSQQKMLLTVCLAAGLATLVAGQAIDPMQCSTNVQQAAGSYRQRLTSIFSEFAQGLTQQGTGSLNTQQLNSDLERLLQLASSLADTSQGFNAQRLTSTLSEMGRLQMSMGRYMFNPNMGLGVFRLYMKMLNQSMGAYTDFMLAVPNNCVPTN